ncbi:HugZ family pyridoxamine 5'-phosphate oxidase [Leptothoe spongobia]|uniref:Pyridoxamine 5'-phosphate oxidase family protein n=1 Tax=Leptothoe spongobia TAU-MAC 1115 TaxID=1967444 RepID=A0A947DF21_9CYAN|nr:pyridoxamine 5'-phosphate oxidase family protein [Leptothoe spongobia]MBT9315857.1 pyridoxamine 5'-phosphate oxidase family protein [Leptothoe spongobia TAU-MAC 1115]
MADFNRVTELYQKFPETFRSVILSTVSTDGIPQASYAPFLIDGDKKIYIYVSGLSTHTANLKQTHRASVLFIEDEAQTQEIFARRRLTYECAATSLPRETTQWQGLIDRFEQRFGKVIGLMKGLPDFQVFQLQPQAGQFVIGFGAAYRVNTDDLNSLEPRRQS